MRGRTHEEAARAAQGLWSTLYGEASAIEASDPVLARSMRRNVLEHPSLGSALAARLAFKLGDDDLPVAALHELFVSQHVREPALADAAASDLFAVLHRDPACASLLTPLLHFSGFLAVQTHRLAHRFWHDDRPGIALHLQARCSQVFGVDIHPAASLGKHLMLDHAHGIVIGETAVVEDDVSMLHGVTLGGRGKSRGDRHPKVRRGASLGAGAQIIGNIELGVHARVGAGSVVLIDVPPFCTAVGVPARVLPPAPLDRPSGAAVDATP